MRRSPGWLTAAGLLLAVILFISLNALSGRFLSTADLDLTHDQLYSLSDGTKAVLGKIEEPVSLKFYYSTRLGQLIPIYGIYADRVRDLLREYASLSHGKVKLQILDPAPFSETEDQATADGMQGVPAEEGGEPVYFGLVGTNSTGQHETIPFFNQDREKFLEYDLTKLVQALAFPKKKVVGLISSLQLDADQMAMMQGRQSQPQEVLNQLRQDYEVRDLSLAVDKIPDDIAVLMVVQPEKLAPKTEYAIDQFVLGGGHALVFVDPDSEFQATHPSMMAPPGGSHAAEFDTLLKAWGVELIKGKVVGDRANARRVNAGGPDHPEAADFIGWINLKGDDLNASDPITGKLGQVNLATAGVLMPIKGAKTSLEWLLRSSDEAELIDASKFASPIPDVLGLLASFKATGERYTIAARVTGPADTAFPNGPPAAEVKPGETKPETPPASAPQIKTAKQPIDIVVVADSDILDNRFWVQMQEFMGRQVGVPSANNADFVQNAVDSLAGTGDLIGLRSRGSAVRPFTRVDAIQKDAQDRYQAQEKALQDQLKETEAKLAGISGEEDASGDVKLTPDQQKAIDQFRVQIIQTRTELRKVQLALRQNIDALKEELVLVDVGVVPFGVAVIAIVIGIVRARRRRRPVTIAT